jgi:hypothetical protein
MSAGSTPFNDIALTATVVSETTGPGELVGVNLYNPNAAVIFVQFFDVAPDNLASITLGTTLPLFWLPVPAGANFHGELATVNPNFVNGIAMAATTTPTGNTAPASPVQLGGFVN